MGIDNAIIYRQHISVLTLFKFDIIIRRGQKTEIRFVLNPEYAIEPRRRPQQDEVIGSERMQ